MSEETNLPTKPSEKRVVNLSAFRKNAKAIAEQVEQSGPDIAFLKFSKLGRYELGKERQEVPPGTKVRVPIGSLVTGFIAWEGGRPVGQVVKPLDQGAVDPSTLPATTAPRGWEPLVGFGVILPDGTEAAFSTSTVGGRNAFASLIRQINEQIEEVEETMGLDGFTPEEAIVELDSDSYNHKEYGRVFYPVFRVLSLK